MNRLFSAMVAALLISLVSAVEASAGKAELVNAVSSLGSLVAGSSCIIELPTRGSNCFQLPN